MSLPAGEPWRRSWQSVCGPDRCRADPYDGVCACALAFSTLLSSQGADAHHPRPLGLIRGNPANLPVLADLVNLVRKTWLAWSRDVHRAYPYFGVSVSEIRALGGKLLALGDDRLFGRSCLPGQDERLGSKGDLVKSRARVARPGSARSACQRSVAGQTRSAPGEHAGINRDLKPAGAALRRRPCQICYEMTLAPFETSPKTPGPEPGPGSANEPGPGSGNEGAAAGC
jgi:hypothetical protein